jgi:phosphoserine phosphatase
LVVVTHCVGGAKLRELSRRFGLSEFSHVYTDSWADQPLMRGATAVTLVSANEGTTARARALLEGRASLRLVRAG